MEIVTDYRAMRRDDVGGKFASQAALRALDVPVPAFFCLSKRLFDRVVAPHRAEIEGVLSGLNLHDRAGLTAAAARLRALIQGLTIDAATAGKIRDTFEQRLPGVRFVSVRACMVCANAEFSEDSVTNPFAGISESYLYVTPESVLDRVKDCWASAFAEKALVYRLSQGIDLMDVSVAVGIQRMIFGKRSFVMFTCDPNTAAHDTLIVAGYGIGEGVVQESVPVDHYFVNAKSGDIHAVVADKASEMGFDEARGFGVRTYPVADERRNAQCLSDDEIRRLRELGQKIERAFDWPQDIEGCLDETGELYFLQARPVAIDYTKKRVWTGLNVTESYPGVSSPLTYSLAKLFYRVIFRDIYRRAGVNDSQLNRAEFSLDRMIGYVNGRIYYSLNAFYLLHHLSPLFPWLCKAWENMVGLKTSYLIKSGENEAKPAKWRARWAVTKAVGNFFWNFVTHRGEMRAYKAWWTERAKTSRALIDRETDALALTEEFYRLWRDVGERWGVTLTNDAYIFTLYAVVSGLMKRWKLDQDPALLSNLLCGDDEVESVEIFLSVLRIAEHIRADGPLAERFLASDDAELVAAYRERRLDAALLEKLDAHIRRYGDRSMEELKVENPSLREDPTVLFRGIRRFVKSDLNAEACRTAELDKRAEAERALDARFGRFSPRKALLRWMLRYLREVIAHRENSRYCRSELFGLCKDIFRAQGRYLAGKGVIEAPADVNFLTIEEIMGYADGTGVDELFHGQVASRRQQLALYAAQEVPETLTTNGGLRDNALAFAKAANDDGEHELKGLGSSMGVAKGTARVVLDPNGVGELPKGSILVAKETDPGWLFLMLASSGIVVERGSMLSHTAITGRKFGIPTVVGVTDATRRIPDGVPVELDGGSGVVKVLRS